MLKTILGAVAGVVTWFVVVTLLNLGLRYGWPDYHAVEKAMTFTLPMMVARLTESTVALIMAALVTSRLARGGIAAPWLLGVILLAIFVPFHITIWDKFPIWYHLTFLISLPVVSIVVGKLAAEAPESAV